MMLVKQSLWNRCDCCFNGIQSFTTVSVCPVCGGLSPDIEPLPVHVVRSLVWWLFPCYDLVSVGGGVGG